MSKKTKNVISISGIIDATTRVDGNIFSENNLKIDGTINGDVSSLCDVVVSERGVVNGNINARSVVIDGVVRGNITTIDTVTLSSSGTIEGDVQTVGLIADIGSTFKGVCKVLKTEEVSAPEEQVSTYQIPVQAPVEEPKPEPIISQEEVISELKAEEEPEPSVYKIKVKKEVEKKPKPEIYIEEKSEEEITSELLAAIAAGIES